MQKQLNGINFILPILLFILFSLSIVDQPTAIYGSPKSVEIALDDGSPSQFETAPTLESSLVTPVSNPRKSLRAMPITSTRTISVTYTKIPLMAVATISVKVNYTWDGANGNLISINSSKSYISAGTNADSWKQEYLKLYSNGPNYFVMKLKGIITFKYTIPVTGSTQITTYDVNRTYAFPIGVTDQ